MCEEKGVGAFSLWEKWERRGQMLSTLQGHIKIVTTCKAVLNNGRNH